MNQSWFNRTVFACLVLLLLGVTVLAGMLIVTLRAQQQMSQDLAEVNHVRHGLLNADVWVQQVTSILEKKVREFEVTEDNRGAIKLSLQRMLDTLITEADSYMRRQKKTGNWWKRATGKVELGVQDALMDMQEVKAGIPRYADKILDELTKPAAREELNSVLKGVLTEVSRSTFAQVDRRHLQAVHAAYQCKERADCQRRIGESIAQSNRHALRLTTAVLGLSALLFVLTWKGRGGTGRALGLLALCSAVLMLCGVLTPMIEVEARISELRFALLDEPVAFTDQVLYFQSKSVLDVVQVLAATGAPDMILVGALIMLFSVIFPLAKLAASFVYLHDLRGLRASGAIRFFALKSGKWSMADVFVVAIFMAYIGFSGLISSQLSNFAASAATEVDILTTNGTSLQIGFFMFLAFCLASLVTSTMIDAAISEPARGRAEPVPGGEAGRPGQGSAGPAPAR